MRPRPLTLAIIAVAIIAGCAGPVSSASNPPSASTAASASPTLGPGSIIPKPTGDQSVGVRDLAPLAGGFALRAWYPALAGSGTPGAPWTTEVEWNDFASTFTNHSAAALARLETTAALDATPASTETPRPVVLLMPGWWVPAASTTVLAQELASHGHVVITIDPPRGSELPELVGDDATIAARAEARGAAVHATLEMLADPKLAELVGPIDAKRVAAGGMSFGGPVGYAASAGEPSVVAVFDLDGSLELIPTLKPVTVPALMVVTPLGGVFDPGLKTTQLLRDSKAVVTVGIRRASHCDLSDMEFVLLAAETSPADFPAGAECFGEIGTDGPTTTATIVRRFIDAVLGTPSTVPTAASLIDGLPDGVLDPIGLGH